MLNANLLLTHAAAALAGHRPAGATTGPKRSSPRCATAPRGCALPPAAAGAHAGLAGLAERRGIQHLVVDTEIAWALAVAWRAREAIGLDAATSAMIADRIIRCAQGEFWRWPALRLNQINWYARIYAAAAEVGGPANDLHGQLLKQLRRFVDGARQPMAGASVSNLGPGYRFRYLPQSSDRHKYNLDTAEYANIVCGFLVAYRQARDAGMPPLDSGRADVIRAWSERVLCGYWTHAGYLNWDTGLGFKRWHQGKKLGLSQAALLGIATCPELAPHSGWAKHILDRSFELFDRWTERGRALPPANAFGVPSIDANEASQVLAAARVQANAAQAALLGLGTMRGEEPPPLYAYDPDVGRLAVSTPSYNTAVVAVNRGAFPYGGVELARLFDREQDVAASVGGRPPAAFGVVVRDGAGAIVAASQREVSDDGEPLRLLEAPRGAGSNPDPFPRRPYAGAFDTLRVRGTARRGGIAIRTTHRFVADHIETEWHVTGRQPRRRGPVPELGRCRPRDRGAQERRAPGGDPRDRTKRCRVVPRRERALRLRGRDPPRRRRGQRIDPAPRRPVFGPHARPDPGDPRQGDDGRGPDRAGAFGRGGPRRRGPHHPLIRGSASTSRWATASAPDSGPGTASPSARAERWAWASASERAR